MRETISPCGTLRCVTLVLMGTCPPMNREEINPATENQVSANPAPNQGASLLESSVEPCEFERLLQRAMEILSARELATAAGGS